MPIANDRGHLLGGIPRSKTSPWGTFTGTWDTAMDCCKTLHSQTLAPLKSEGTSCLNNQVKNARKSKQSDLTLTNKKQDKVFQDFSKVRPDRSDSPITSPSGNKEIHVTEAQKDIQVANHDQPVTTLSPIENKVSSPLKASPVASPVAGSPKPQTPVTPTLEDKPLTPIKPSSPLAQIEETNRKSLSPEVN